jgi:hypothetical protein
VGESAYVFSGDSSTSLTGNYHGFTFGASHNGVSFGYYTNSLSEEFLVAQTTPSLGFHNPPPKVGPVVISEIHYHPPDENGQDVAELEFIELHNISSSITSLYDPQFPTNTWRLESAVEFSFPPNRHR